MKAKLPPPPIVRLLLVFLMCLPLWGSHAFAQNAESYAVFDEATNTLTFKHDTNKPDGAFALTLDKDKDLPGWFKGDFGDNKNIIKKVIFDASFAYARPTSCRKWFCGCNYLTNIEGIENLNTENVTDMSYMFYGCSALTTLDVSNFNTQNVTDMSGMFEKCSALTTLDLSNFKTHNVTDMSYMFHDCSALTTLDISSFDTQNVTSMRYMFCSCRNLTTLDVSKFNTKNVTNMEAMFAECCSLTTLNVSKFDTQNVTDMSSMFHGCSALTTLDLSNFKTQNVTDMYGMFKYCSALTILDLSNFNTQNVEELKSMFYDCSALTTLDISSFDTQNVTDMAAMFYGCSALTTLDLSNFKTQNLTDMSYMFYDCITLKTIYASDKFVTTACSDWGGSKLFYHCYNLVGAVPYDENKVGKEMANYTTGYFTYKTSGIAQKAESYAVFDEATNTLTFKHDTNKPDGAFALTLNKDYLPGWFKGHFEDNKNIIKKVIFDASFAYARPTSCHKWFYGCNYLTNIEGIENLNTENVIDMSYMFYGCSALTTLDVSKFDTKNVTNMRYMFSSCRNLTTLDVSKFNTKNVTNMIYMFYGCSALTTLNLSNFNTQNVTNMKSMFDGCSALTTLDLSNFDTQNVEDMREMFYGCSALTTLDISSFDTHNVTYMDSMFEGCSALTTIYASENYVTTACRDDSNMFLGCTNLVGAVPYDENKIGKEMANYTTGYFTYKAATGIDAPTVTDDTAAEYYDLQGRRLNAPQKGVNIVKRGKKTTKMLVK